MKRNMHVLVLSFIILTMACAPMGIVNVQISREHYKPQFEQAKYAEYKGQLMSL